MIATLARSPRSLDAEGMASLITKLTLKRRWVQVSLRSVLMLVTLLCVALSMRVVPAEWQPPMPAFAEGGGSAGSNLRSPSNRAYRPLRRCQS